jgi:hypothetical protein
MNFQWRRLLPIDRWKDILGHTTDTCNSIMAWGTTILSTVIISISCAVSGDEEEVMSIVRAQDVNS